MEYSESKKTGDIGEEEILKRIKKQYPQAYIDERGKANSDWDIWIPEKQYGVEVKMDYKSKETGNLLIEVEMNGFFSALTITKAKYWVFITGYHFIWITPLEIYRFLEIHFFYGRTKFTGKGDTAEKTAHLPNLNRFIDYVKNLDKSEGWVENILENNILYYDNLIKKINDEIL